MYRSASSSFTTLEQIEAGTPVGSFAMDINTLDVTGLTPSTPYYFNVIAKDTSGNKSAYTVCTGSTIAPLNSVVTMASATADNDSITLNWTNPTAESVGIDHIQITAGASTWTSASGAASFTTPGTLTASTDYPLTVKIVDIFGNICSTGISFTITTSADTTPEVYHFIDTATELNDVRNNLADNYIMMTNINLTAYSDWTPIGEVTIDGSFDSPTIASGAAFTGIFDGNEYTISNLTIASPTSDGQGLFGFIGNTGSTAGATIKNVTLTGVNVAGQACTGALAAYSGYSAIKNCSTAGTVSGTYCVGGLVGYAKGTTDIGAITDCVSSVNVTGTSRYNGGLIGLASYMPSISGCSASGTVTNNDASNAVFIGGLVGSIESSGISTMLSNCHATGAVSANTSAGNSVGGLAGNFTGMLASTGVAGCLVSNCYASGNVSGYDQVGGLFGQLNIEAMTGSYAQGTVTGGRDMIGGLVGYNLTKLTDCYATGNVTGATSGAFNTGNQYGVGGLVGANASDLTKCHAEGTVTNTGSCTGGLVGSTSGNLSKCYAIGGVTGTDAVGGLVGSFRLCIWNTNPAGITASVSSTISNCYATGGVSGATYVGGLVGVNYAFNETAAASTIDYTLTITNCYSAGVVSASSTPVKGFLGGYTSTNTGGGTITFDLDNVSGSYFDSTAAGQTDTLASGQTTANMKIQGTYSGWDFTAIWAISSGAYPTLR